MSSFKRLSTKQLFDLKQQIAKKQKRKNTNPISMSIATILEHMLIEELDTRKTR